MHVKYGLVYVIGTYITIIKSRDYILVEVVVKITSWTILRYKTP